ncbi:MAG: response regulator transcription factor [Acidimicrobiia bacterium]|nr:response regulator transcription factor [Acidimicrobiia bacterium]MDH4363034.1 response regulator transcription factor [Acidimicrobiia bacterium]MDH5290052.1 response regulator transcription factor [Acidimicrobiia bacterium]
MTTVVSTILTVEDERDVRIGIRLLLEDDGFEVSEAATYAEALDAMRRSPVDLVLVDVKLPDRNGFDLCRALRQQGHRLPIIMLTAQVDSHDVVAGLEAGADDYVTKPFVPKELTARIRAALRRMERVTDTATPPTELVFGDLVLRPGEGQVTRQGVPIDLTRIEFLLLVELAQHAGLLLTRDQLLERVWGYERMGDSRLVDAHVSRLRAKIEEQPGEPRYLLTVRGLGYRFVRPGPGAESPTDAP